MRGIRTLLLTDACLRGGAENDGHENAGLWTCFRCLNRPTWNRLRFNRLLLRFQECSRSKNKLKTIRLYSCLLGLPLLPADDISPAFDEVKLAVSSDSRFVSKLNDKARLTNGLRIKPAKKKMNLINERRLQEVYTTYFAVVTCILPLF